MIRLAARTAGNYLIIKCENPPAEAPGRIPEGTGYGLKILQDMAKRYEGDFRTDYRDYLFTAQLSLRFR